MSRFAEELAARSGIPANYLSKLLLTLGNAGLIEEVRGTGGGYRLARKPESVLLAEIVELIDGGVARPQCLLGLRQIVPMRTRAARTSRGAAPSRHTSSSCIRRRSPTSLLRNTDDPGSARGVCERRRRE